MSISTALEARRDALRDREAGFTLIELLVVVIIIGVLAAIAIPVYLGVQNSAKDSAAKSDLTNDKVAVVAASTNNNGTLPATGATGATAVGGSTLASYGWTTSTGTTATTYTLSASGTAFCIVETSAAGNQFSITRSGSVASGACPAADTNW
ncbi:prepilin-type N-terminal cleavage/methylation domain-containing protein [Amnibacterium sp. CER49]|uniref:type IV pilin protein n=1 Tax=Amnibacterium sp. CER49 TaxID=3039161 RepID=UPI00244B6A04|nr:prepilin-type N-terminal cleavage/methylation domain-containing protein [Amnibacterium sp. CER49]MDH2443883.1 prepilin-type N-terminal cleavage/methylation domain-containing protein [Amnibacterium sp. CER49]